MATNGHLLYYPEGKHDILLGKELNDILKSKVNSVTKITYQDLKKLRDNSKLTPGALYRITDYQCTTTQENTRSAGHQFDIVLLALSENKLAEEGWAMMHENIYDVTFSDGVTKKCWIYETEDEEYNIVFVDTLIGCGYIDPYNVTINEENKTATVLFGTVDMNTPDLTYNYFQNSNLSAWKVWYCLDNDKSRFAWADDSVDEDVEENIKINGGTTSYFRYSAGDTIYENTKLYAWKSLDDIIRYSKTEEVESGILVYQFLVQGLTEAGMITSYTPYHKGTGPNGRGVIYRLIDEWMNDVPYDFKNIQYQLRLDNNVYIDGSVGEYTWVYTFDALNLDTDERTDATLIDRTILIDDGYNKISNNFIGASEDYNTVTDTELPYICFLVSWNSDDTYFGVYGNIFNNSSECYFSKELSNVLLIDCHFGSQSRLVTDSSTFYINDKKVLTES